MPTRLACLVCLLAFATGPALAAEEPASQPAEAQQPQPTGTANDLPEHLRTLLQEEMRQLQAGMAAVVIALPAGDWPAVAQTAADMRDSYLLKQSLTEADAAVLHETLPDGFRDLDGRFHDYADRLAQSAEARDTELAAFYYSRLLDTCIRCHTAYAPERFPGLSLAVAHGAHH